MIKALTLWFPFVLVPLVAWSRDIAVVILAYGACALFVQQSEQWRDRLKAARHSPLVYLGVGFLVWSFTAIFWAPHAPFITWVKVFALLCAGTVLAIGLSNTSMSFVEKLERPILVAALTLLGLLIVERLTGGFFIRLDRASETPEKILDVLSGGLVLLGCISFCISWFIWRKTKSWIWPSIMVGACLVLSLSYRMDAIPTGLVFGALLFGIVWLARAKAFVAVIFVIAVVALAWGPLATLASAMSIDAWLTEDIDYNWGYRVVIWQHVGELLRNNILHGYGFDSARVVGAATDLFPERPGLATFLHPHNGMLQIWLELGVVGVALLVCTFGMMFAHILKTNPSRGALATIAGTFGFTTTIWLLSYGVWQGWWLAVIGLTVCSVGLVLKLDGETSSDERPPQDSERVTRYSP